MSRLSANHGGNKRTCRQYEGLILLHGAGGHSRRSSGAAAKASGLA